MYKKLTITVPEEMYNFINDNRSWFVGRFMIDGICNRALADARSQIEQRMTDYQAGYAACTPSLYSIETRRLVKAILADTHHAMSARLDMVMDALVCDREQSYDFWSGYFDAMNSKLV